MNPLLRKKTNAGHSGLEPLILIVPICLISFLVVLPLGLKLGSRWGYRPSKRYIAAAAVVWPGFVLWGVTVAYFFVGLFIAPAFYGLLPRFLFEIVTVILVGIVGSVFYFAWAPAYIERRVRGDWMAKVILILAALAPWIALEFATTPEVPFPVMIGSLLALGEILLTRKGW